MKKLTLLLLFTICLFSCSADESAQRFSQSATFELNSDEVLSLISIRINDEEGQTIQNYDFQYEQSISIPVTEGVQIMVYVVDEDEFEYNYSMTNFSEILFEGVQEGVFNHTLIKSYEL